MNGNPLRRISAFSLFCCMTLTASTDQPAATEIANRAFDLQGHRGARGLLPENTIPAFQLALDLGVTTLEMDVAINAEGHVVLSHEPWMSAKICSHPDGRKVAEDEEKRLRIYAMNKGPLLHFKLGRYFSFPERNGLKLHLMKLC